MVLNGRYFIDNPESGYYEVSKEYYEAHNKIMNELMDIVKSKVVDDGKRRGVIMISSTITDENNNDDFKLLWQKNNIMENKNPFQNHLDNEKALRRQFPLTEKEMFNKSDAENQIEKEQNKWADLLKKHPDIDEELRTYNLHPHSNKSLKVLTEDSEGGWFDTNDIKRLIFLLQEYIKC